MSNKIFSKQNKVKISEGFLSNKDGKDGDIRILQTEIENPFLCAKLNGKWHSVKLSDLEELNFTKNHNIETTNFIKAGGNLETQSELKARGATSLENTLSVTGAATLSDSLSVAGISTLTGDTKKPLNSKIYLDSDQTTSNNYITSDASGNIKMYVDGKNVLNATSTSLTATEDSSDSHTDSNASFQIFNADGDARIALKGKSSAELAPGGDTYISFLNHQIATDYYDGWIIGVNTSDTDKFVWNKMENDGSTTASTTAQTQMSLTQTGALETEGNISQNVTGTSITAGTLGFIRGNLTITQNEIDLSSGDLTLDVAGNLIVDKDINNTTAATNTPGFHIDYDRIGAVTSGTDINKGLDLDVNVTGAGTSGTPTVTSYGIDLDVVGDVAGSGTSTNYGIHMDVDGADNNIGLYIDTAGTHIKLAANADPATDYATIAVADTGDLTIATFGDGSTDSDLTFNIDGAIDINSSASDSITLNAGGDITLDADGADVVFQDGGTSSKFAKFSNFINSGYFNLYSVADNDDYSNMSCGTNGATSWVTYGSAADITINPAGSIDLRGTGSISLDPDTHTLSKLCLGFTQHTPTFNATDTYVYFYNLGNKATLTLTNNVTDIHFRFPAVSGNFICVLLQDGTGGRTISNFKTQDASGNAGDDGGGTPGSIRWAGGTEPTNTETANKADIASFYWDADNEIAYGTYSYNF